MPNIKSSIRSVKTDAERRAKNAPIKAALRNASRKVEARAKTGSQKIQTCKENQRYGLILTS